MEVKGRECEEVKVGEYTMYFLSNFKGREYRKTLEAQQDSVGDGDFDAAKFTINIPKLFPVFCMKCTKGEQEVKVEPEVLDDLSVEDYVKIQEKLSTLVMQLFDTKKK